MSRVVAYSAACGYQAVWTFRSQRGAAVALWKDRFYRLSIVFETVHTDNEDVLDAVIFKFGHDL